MSDEITGADAGLSGDDQIMALLKQKPMLRKAKRAFILPTHPSPPTTHIQKH